MRGVEVGGLFSLDLGSSLNFDIDLDFEHFKIQECSHLGFLHQHFRRPKGHLQKDTVLQLDFVHSCCSVPKFWFRPVSSLIREYIVLHL